MARAHRGAAANTRGLNPAYSHGRYFADSRWLSGELSATRLDRLADGAGVYPS
jgi:hypothetical protein